MIERDYNYKRRKRSSSGFKLTTDLKKLKGDVKLNIDEWIDVSEIIREICKRHSLTCPQKKSSRPQSALKDLLLVIYFEFNLISSKRSTRNLPTRMVTYITESC